MLLLFCKENTRNKRSASNGSRTVILMSKHVCIFCDFFLIPRCRSKIINAVVKMIQHMWSLFSPETVSGNESLTKNHQYYYHTLLFWSTRENIGVGFTKILIN